MGALAAFAVLLVASWAYWYGLRLDPPLIAGTVVLGAFVLLGEVFSERVNERLSIGASDVGLVMAVVLLGPTWAALAALPADLLAGKKSWLRSAYEVGHSVSIVYLAGLVFSFVSDPLLLGVSGASADVLYGTLIAGATLVGANGLLDGVLLKVKYGQDLRETWEENARPYLLSNGVDVLTAGLGVLALTAYGPVAAVIAVAGSVGSQALVRFARDKAEEVKDLRDRNRSLAEALAGSNAKFGAMMVGEMGRKDGYTDRHAAATATYAADVGREMGMDGARVERLRLAGLLHNIGMFGLPEELLLTTGKINSVARGRISEHPARGQEVLASVPEYEELASWVRWHHERPDGRGYPDKLRGPWLPPEAKILAATQAYAAMVLDQPRRPGLGPAEARRELSRGADTQFDGTVVKAFLRILDTESEGYRRADDHRFSFRSSGPDGQAPASCVL